MATSNQSRFDRLVQFRKRLPGTLRIHGRDVSTGEVVNHGPMRATEMVTGNTDLEQFVSGFLQLCHDADEIALWIYSPS